MKTPPAERPFTDVLCIGMAPYDLTFAVEAHPQPDEKLFAQAFTGCGGGPAANAAVAVARLGGSAAFAGYLGNDPFGAQHLAELQAEGVNVDLVWRGATPTPLSTIWAKPDGRRALVSYRPTPPAPAGPPDWARLNPRVILTDGHEPALSQQAVTWARAHAWARAHGAPTVLDAGSRHAGTEALHTQVDYLVASAKFARQMTGRNDPEQALAALAGAAPCVVITLGEDGVIWQRGKENGRFPAVAVTAVDTTGAGDSYHGAFALGVARRWPWPRLLHVAAAVAALTCTRLGARHAIPRADEVWGKMGVSIDD